MAALGFDHIMIDTETLGTGPDSVILSVGAVKFTTDGAIDDNGFYASISIDSQPTRKISEQTLKFWLKQKPDAQGVFFEDKVSLEVAMADLYDWFDHDNYKVWSNGADFDIPLVKHAMNQYGIEAPWKFWNQRCFRTLKSIPPGISAPKPAPTVAHNALSDALAQVIHLHNIYAMSKPGYVPENPYVAKKP